MKTEKTHFTVAEIDKQAQALMDEDGAIQTFERRPLRTALEMLDSISIAGLYSSVSLIRFLQRGDIPGHAARPSDANNEKLFHTFDLWIDHHASNPMEIAAALVAQVPHMIARAWKRGDSAQDSILKLESAMYQFTARQLEADFQWMEDTATEADPEPVDISGDPVIDRVLTWVRDTFPGARMDRIQQPDIPDWLVEPLRQAGHNLADIKTRLLRKYTECEPMEFYQFDGWDVGVNSDDDILPPDQDGHSLCCGPTWELRRSPEDLRVRVFIPIDTDPKVALPLMRKLNDWVKQIAESGAPDFRPDSNQSPF